MTFRVIILALAASGFTAMASVAQRRAAAPRTGRVQLQLAPGGLSPPAAGVVCSESSA